MRAWLCVMLSAGLSLQAQSVHPVGALDLEEYLASAQHTPDGDVATQLSVMELTESLSSSQVAALQSRCPGKKCRRALLALTDQSAFLDVPDAEAASSDAPSELERKQMVSKLISFVSRMHHQMPNFIATRTTTRFEDSPTEMRAIQERTERPHPLQFAAESHATITYRNGEEIVDKEKVLEKAHRGIRDEGQLTRGLFGSILTTVLLNTSKTGLKWSHWQHNGAERVAVFRFEVPMERSTYRVTFCCIPVSGGLTRPLDRMTAYHGELAVNPADGTVSNITIFADLDQGDLPTLLQEAVEGQPLLAANLAVKYGRVEIGGKQYTCPIRAVAYSRARTLIRNQGFGPVTTYLSDMSFTAYHVFRSESRILTGFREP